MVWLEECVESLVKLVVNIWQNFIGCILRCQIPHPYLSIWATMWNQWSWCPICEPFPTFLLHREVNPCLHEMPFVFVYFDVIHLKFHFIMAQIWALQPVSDIVMWFACHLNVDIVLSPVAHSVRSINTNIELLTMDTDTALAACLAALNVNLSQAEIFLANNTNSASRLDLPAWNPSGYWIPAAMLKEIDWQS